MATFDYFVGTLKCGACDYGCDDRSSNIQTKLRVRPELADLKVGDKPEVNWHDIGSAGYLQVAESVDADTISILETWECPSCDKPFNWARIEIRNGSIESIHEVDLTSEVLQSANFICEDSKYLLDAPTSPELTVEALLAQLQGS